MAQVERRLAVAGAPAAPPAIAPTPAPPPPPPAAQPPTEESNDDSSDRRQKEKKEKKKKKKEKSERRERERSQGQGGGYMPAWGGLRMRGRGKWWWTRGTGTGTGMELSLLTAPNHPPPLPQWLLKALGPQSATARKAGPIPWSAQVLEQGCAGDQLVFSSPPHSHMTVMWIFRRLIRCLIRRKEGEHKGPWCKDASRGGVWVWKPLPGAPLAPLPEAISAGAWPALNLLFDPRGVRFGTPHDLVLLQHWAQLGWVTQWRRGKAVAFGVDRATHLALPRPIYDPGCQPSYEGLVPRSRAVKAAAVAVNVAKPAA